MTEEEWKARGLEVYGHPYPWVPWVNIDIGSFYSQLKYGPVLDDNGQQMEMSDDLPMGEVGSIGPVRFLEEP